MQAGGDINPSLRQPGATGSYPLPFILWTSSEPGLVRSDPDPPSTRVFNNCEILREKQMQYSENCEKLPQVCYGGK